MRDFHPRCGLYYCAAVHRPGCGVPVPYAAKDTGPRPQPAACHIYAHHPNEEGGSAMMRTPQFQESATHAKLCMTRLLCSASATLTRLSCLKG